MGVCDSSWKHQHEVESEGLVRLKLIFKGFGSKICRTSFDEGDRWFFSEFRDCLYKLAIWLCSWSYLEVIYDV